MGGEMEIRELQTKSLGVPDPLNIYGKARSAVTQCRSQFARVQASKQNKTKQNS